MQNPNSSGKPQPNDFALTPEGKKILSRYRACRNAAAAIDQALKFRLPEKVVRQRIAEYDHAEERLISASNFTLN